MPLDSPQLDDLTYATVRDLLIRQIPTVAPEWTDRNDSDPGVAMIQLFAYLAEQVGYRLNRVPDKNYIEFLKLIGILLKPAEAARTTLELILARAETSVGFLLPAGTRVKAASGGGAAGPPTYETDADLDVVPSQLAALVTTASSDLRQIRPSIEGPPDASIDTTDYVQQRYTLVWNGKTPKLKDMPAQAVPVFPQPTTPPQEHLWIGLAFNPSPSAGFLGQRVTLTLQMADDERPDPTQQFSCGTEDADLTDPLDPNALPPATYQYYRPLPSIESSPSPPTITSVNPPVPPATTAVDTVWRYRIVGELADGSFTPPSAEGSTTTGPSAMNGGHYNTISWTVPSGAVNVHVYRVVSGGTPLSTGRIAVIPSTTTSITDQGLDADGSSPPVGGWRDLNILSDTTDGWTRSGLIRFDVPSDLGPIPDEEWAPVRPPSLLTTVQIRQQASGGSSQPPPQPVPHPLVGAIKVPVEGAPTSVPVMGWVHVAFPGVVPSFSLRALSFNVAPASNAQTVRNELLGRGTGLPGQILSLANQNVLDGTLQLAVTDLNDSLLHVWTPVDSFDAQSADATVYLLDREAGQVTFGDGVRGKPPADTARVVALQYRWGGGQAAEVPVATITKPDSVPSDISDVTNIVAALGGKDAETLAEAKLRAPQELKVLGRAVTVDDFVFLAKQTPGLRVARAVVVPLARPLVNPNGPGLDFTVSAAGALSVMVVPDAPANPWPTPTKGMLRTVCKYLDQFRLVTTEVHTVPPMYVRLFQIKVAVNAQPGYTRTALRETIAAQLEKYFNVVGGGPDGAGFPFGGAVHHADLVAQVFRVPGVATVLELVALFNGQTPKNSVPAMAWRQERQTFGTLTNCPVAATDTTVIQLAGDENVFVDASDLEVAVQ